MSGSRYIKRLGKDNFKIMVVNCRSFIKNKHNLLQEVDVYNPDIIVATETYLTENVKDSELDLNDYDIFRKDKASNSGGVLIATRKLVNGETVNEKECEIKDITKNYEFLAVNINLGNKIGKVKIVGVYRHNDNDNAEVLDVIKRNIIDKTCKEMPVIIAGDLNLPKINWQEYRTDLPVTATRSTNVEKQINVSNLLSQGFTQVVRSGTRLAPSGVNNILDIVLLKPEIMWLETEVVKGFSDHDIPIVTLAFPSTVNKYKKTKVFKYDRADQVGIVTKLEEGLKDFIMSPGNVNDKWNYYKKIMEELNTEFVPSKMVSDNSDPPYYNKEVKSLKKRVRKLYLKFRRGEVSHSTLEKVRNELTVAKHLALEKYLEDIMQTNNQTKCWKQMYKHINRLKKGGQQIPSLKVNGVTFSGDEEKADILGSQYEKVYQKAGMVNNEQNDIEEEDMENADFYFEEKRLLKIILELEGRKAAGPDGISARLLKIAPVQQCKYIGHIIDKILEECKIPDEWKTAVVIPIFKGGERNKPENYRPVSLTCIVCKIVEKLFEEYTEYQLNNKNFYGNNQQHGFRKGFSCDTQLLGFTEDIIDAFREGKEIVAVFLDYEKAFDKVPHSLLLEKAEDLVNDKRVLKVMKDFLQDRTIKVKVNDTLSRNVNATSGVPQGSVWGPRLFNMFIQDLIDEIQNSKIRLFADDAVIYKIIESEEDMELLQDDLSRASDWVDKNLMSLNVNKCKSVCFSRKKIKRDCSNLTLKQQPLESQDEYKYLGVTIDDKLEWDQQISKVVKKGNQIMNFIFRNLKGTNKDVKLAAYLSLIRPILEYASLVWDPSTITASNQLEKIQNRAARRITGKTYKYILDDQGNKRYDTVSVTNLKHNLGLPLLEDRRRKTRLTAMYKIVHGRQGWNEFQGKYEHSKYISSRLGDHDLKIQIVGQTSDFAKYATINRTTIEWNRLPRETVHAKSAKHFRKLL
jgi:Reverse transcriptase (RNA-dependent DNA polymerase)/Endonuclease-reverse transcriptase